MRKFLASAAVVALATPAFAGLGIDARFDYFSAQGDSYASGYNTGVTAFTFNWLRVVGTGRATDNAGFRFSLNPMAVSNYNPSTAVVTPTMYNATGYGNGSVTDYTGGNTAAKLLKVNPLATGLQLYGLPVAGVSDLIDYAEVDIHMSDSFTLSAGKLGYSGLSGFEGYTLPLDTYFSSASDYGYTYLTGVEGWYQITDTQKVLLVLANNTSPTFNNLPYFSPPATVVAPGTILTSDNSRPAVGLMYNGQFGAFGVQASYHTFGQGVVTTATGATNSVNFNPATIGISYKYDDLTVSLDYDNVVTTNAAITGNNKTQNSYVLNAAYDFGWVSVKGKYEGTQQQGYETTSALFTGGPLTTYDTTTWVSNYSIAAEFKQNPKDAFRYHIAYVSGSTSYGGTPYQAYGLAASQFSPVNVSASYAFLGIRYAGDFLK